MENGEQVELSRLLGFRAQLGAHFNTFASQVLHIHEAKCTRPTNLYSINHPIIIFFFLSCPVVSLLPFFLQLLEG
jgi:hypothetical protein